jgi:hypothetical protein
MRNTPLRKFYAFILSLKLDLGKADRAGRAGGGTAGASGGRIIRGREHNGCLAGQEAKGEALLEIKPDDRVGVSEIADGDILPDVEFEITSARGQDKRALYGRSPDDVAFDNALDVLQDGISVITGFRKFGISFCSE